MHSVYNTCYCRKLCVLVHVFEVEIVHMIVNVNRLYLCEHLVNHTVLGMRI